MRRSRRVTWRKSIWTIAVAILAVCVAVAALELPSRAAVGDEAGLAASRWITTWGASPQSDSPHEPLALRGFQGQTIREVVFASVGGSRVRVRFTNQYGTRPLRIGRAAIALDPGAGPAITGSGVALSFAGRPSATIAPGAEVTSDPASLSVAPLQDLAISIFLPSPTGPATDHALAQQRNYVASGDRVLASRLPASARAATSWFFLDDVSVLAPPAVRGAVIAVGDSITDGFHSTVNANQRWPNDLARRLDAHHGVRLSVVDEGIAGNRVLTASPCYGANAVARAERDVLDQPGVRDVILLEGINDLGMSQSRGWCSLPHREVSARQVIAGDEQIIDLVHRAGVRIFGATMIPFRGARYWTPAAEAKREAVNQWIRTSGAFDGVIDLAAALAEPGHPQMLAPRYDSGDHLHPDDAGYQAIAGAVDLTMLLRP